MLPAREGPTGDAAFGARGWTASPGPSARPELRADPSQGSGFTRGTFPPPSPGICLVGIYFAAVGSCPPAPLLRGTAAAPPEGPVGSVPIPACCGAVSLLGLGYP